MISRILMAMLALALSSIATAAEKTEPLDPKASYILVEVQHLENAMLKGAKMPGVLTIARYDPVNKDIRGGTLSPSSALPKTVAPRLALTNKPVAKTKTSRQFLVKVEPDTWVIEGASGTAFSLGSMMFVVNPGEIVDLGVVKPTVDWLDGEGPKSMKSALLGSMFFGSMKPKEIRPVRLELQSRGSSDLPVPAAIAGRKITTPLFTPGATFGNYLGGLINRLGGRASRSINNPTAPALEAPKANELPL